MQRTVRDSKITNGVSSQADEYLDIQQVARRRQRPIFKYLG